MSKFKRYMLFTIPVMGILLLVGLTVNSNNEIDAPEYIDEIKVSKVNFKDSNFNKDSLKSELIKLKILHIDIVFAQAKLETGNFKSNLFIKNNNLFGFRGKNGYIKYSHWKESVKAYLKFQQEYYKSGDYYRFLEIVGYAEDTNYVNKVRKCVE